MKTPMVTRDARLASFKPRARRRSSVAGSSTKRPAPFKWPHSDLDPEILAHAGFWFNPSESSGDNVCCYLCEKCLDGWEAEDDPIVEHLRHSSDCGWAVTVAIQHNVGNISSDPQDPLIAEARLQTFGEGLWPHEGQGTGNLNIDRMVDAGFHYFPVKDGKDNAFCPYCEVELANWEPEDDPFEEHRRRAKDCPFIVSKMKKPKKRTSRASIQSVVSEVNLDEEPKRGRKAGRGKTATKARGKKSARSSSIEPTPELDVAAPKRGRKRGSNTSHPEPVIIFDGTKDSEDEAEQAPNPRPVKRRTRASNVQKFDILDHESSAEGFPQPTKATARTGRKGATAKQSTKTAAKKARPHLDEDDEVPLDIQLGEPVTEEDELPVTNHKPFVRTVTRTTRTRASILVEQEAKNAPEDVLIHTAKRPKGKAPGQIPDSIQRSPVKPFFKDQDQDFSIPIKIPQHYPRESQEMDDPIMPFEEEEYEGRNSEEYEITVAPKSSKGRAKKPTVTETKAASKAKKPVTGGRGRKKIPVEEVPNSDIDEDQEMPDVSVEPSSQRSRKNGNQSLKITRHRSPSATPVDTELDEDTNDQQSSFADVPDEDMGQQSDVYPPSDDDTIPDDQSELRAESLVSESDATPIESHEVMDEDNASQISAAHGPYNVPENTTPTTKPRPRITTTAPWVPADLQAVFPSPKDSDATGPVELTEEEKVMTVEEWIKWNAAAAEKRHCELAEQRVKLLEEHGRRAVAALEGIQIC